MYMNPMWPSKGNKEKHLCPSETRKLLWQGLWARPLRGSERENNTIPLTPGRPLRKWETLKKLGGGRGHRQVCTHRPGQAGPEA